MMNHLIDENSNLYRVRHTLAHVLAQAVLSFYPKAKLGIGPPIQDGFYYDFDLGVDENGRSQAFSPDDLPRIEQRMRQILAGNHPLVYREIDAEAARQLFADQPYKLELIEELVEGETAVLSTFRQDSFEDLCRGPHVEKTADIPAKAFALLSVAGAYWRGDEKRPQLQRIYGTAWLNKKALRQHLHQLEEAKKRDHRKLGRELDIFIIDEEIGQGLPLWLPNGNILRQELEKLAREVESEADYEQVSTPHIAKESFFQRSGHLPYYEDDMYPPFENDKERYYLKPMNCPFHHKIFGSRPRSYRDLPLRLAEYGMVYRYEQSGELMGLMRVRGAQQNDAHIYCTPEQVEAEFLSVMQLYQRYFALFSIEKFVMRLSKHDPAKLGEKFVDNRSFWLKMEAMVRQMMQQANIPFVEAEGEAAFYGPKIDVQVWSASGREFSLATNQVDFVQPARFNLKYIDANGEEQIPLCIHRAPLGSHERFIGFLLEHYGGEFPVWLAPQQVSLIPITDAHHDYAHRLAQQMKQAGIRAKLNLSSERMNAKIRNAQLQKVPYMVIVGNQELDSGTVSVRLRNGEQRNGVSAKWFIEDVLARINGRLPSL